MLNNKRILAFIPARSGSKGIPNKNIIELLGKPLLAYTIEAALGCPYVDDVVVSTDSWKIAETVKRFGGEVPVLRPDMLASDDAKTIHAVLHMVDFLYKQNRQYDVIILLQPTSPLRGSDHICRAVEKFFQHGEEALVSVSEVTEHPLLMRTIVQGRLKNLLDTSSTVRRQDFPSFYKVNGAVYINKVDSLHENISFNDNPIPYLMPNDVAIDIDTIDDLKEAERLLQNRRR